MDSENKNETQARLKVEQDTRAFLKTFNYEKELGVFSQTWKLYKDLPLSKFREAAPQEDRMILPGMEAVVDVSNIAIQTFGGVVEAMIRGLVTDGGSKLHTLVQNRALAIGAPKYLAKELADFFTKQFEN